MRIRMLILCGLCTASSVAPAAVYRCDGPAGPAFQDMPCAAGPLPVVDGAVRSSTSGLRESERRWLRQRAGRKSRSVETVRRHVRDDRAQQRRCWKRRVALEKVKARLRHGYRPSQGERLRRQRRNGEDYLSRFCD